MAYNKRQHLADNMAALEYLFMRPEFCLTEEGRKVLNGYTGFGVFHGREAVQGVYTKP